MKTAIVMVVGLLVVGCGTEPKPEECVADADHLWCVQKEVNTWAPYAGERPTEEPTALSNSCIGGWWPALQRDDQCVDVIETVDDPFCLHLPETQGVVPPVGLFSRPCSEQLAFGCERSADELSRWCWVFPGGWPLLE